MQIQFKETEYIVVNLPTNAERIKYEVLILKEKISLVKYTIDGSESVQQINGEIKTVDVYPSPDYELKQAVIKDGGKFRTDLEVPSGYDPNYKTTVNEIETTKNHLQSVINSSQDQTQLEEATGTLNDLIKNTEQFLISVEPFMQFENDYQNAFEGIILIQLN